MTLEKISERAIRKHLDTREIGRRIVYRPAVSSTMDVALSEIEQGAAHGTVVVAGTQKKGKGRLRRNWISPPGGVYLSIILYPPPTMLTSLTMVACLAVLDCIQDIGSLRANIKWPNDVLIGGKKVAGVLAQSGKTQDGRIYAVVGIGINANSDVSGQPEIADSATSLIQTAGKEVSLLALICGLLANFEKYFSQLSRGEPVWQQWRDSLVTLGQQVHVKSGHATYSGVAESVDSSGDLLLRLADGTLREIPAGDVTLRT